MMMLRVHVVQYGHTRPKLLAQLLVELYQGKLNIVPLPLSCEI
jgi:hypothetical protein